MMGIDRTLLEDGKEYWVSSLRINSSFRIEKVGKVKKMKFTKINPNSPLSSYVYGYVQDVNGSNNHVEVTRWSSYKFFITDEEAIEEYNKYLLNELDHLEHYYQERKSRLKNILYNE